MATQYFGHIETFDPDVDNWTVYLECLEQFFAANSVTDKKKVSVLLTSLGKKGYSLLRNLVVPAKPADKGYDDLVRVMKEHFTPKPAVIAKQYCFHQRKQHEGETSGICIPFLDQIRTEFFAAIKKFHQYVYGRKFILQTDHKPLTMILGSKSKLPTLAAARVQRWAILLSAYEYEIEYRPTEKHGNADGLSHLPLQSSICSKAEKATLFNLSQIALLPPTPAQLRRSTEVDPVLSKVHSYLVHGWPEQIDENLKPYYLCRDEMTIEAGCLLWGMRVVLPSKYRDWILQELHRGHVGMVRMKALARGRVWWPKLNESIEEVRRSCSSRQSVQK